MSWLAVALWGAVVGVDATSFPQVMISRPLIAATVVGLVFGRPAEGAVVGLVLEIAALLILPIGAARYPEAGTGAVAAAGAYMGAAEVAPPSVLLLLAVVFGLVWERVGSASVHAVRRLNARLVAGQATDARLGAARLERLHLTAIGVDALRGAVVAGGGAVVGAVLLRVLAPHWALGAEPALGALAVAGAALLGGALSLFGGWSERRLGFGLGVLCGLTFLLFR